MMKNRKGWQLGLRLGLQLRLWCGIVGSIVLMSDVVNAQVVPDETLGSENSQVRRATVRGREADLIEGGAARGRNLFHSFREFGVRQGDAAYFANPATIENIFSRVTGNNPSNILGTLGVDGSANLFFMNPNGILFGPNASLDVQGSFVGTTANAIQFGELGFFRANDGLAPGLLTINPSAFFFNQVAGQAGTVTNTGNLTAGQDLTLSGNTLDLQGQLQAGRNLTLEARDTLRIRDSVTAPFVAAANGQMLVQGDRVVDIFALNHPNSGLVSGGDMVLRSANQVGGDAHYWSGGNFRIERLDGSLGDLYSPYDPIIRVTGNLTLNNYIGNSLHILAGGSVVIPGTIAILGSDSSTTTLAENVTLSEGTTINIDGSIRPTLDIRAGVDPSVVDAPNGFEQIGSGNFPGGGTFSRTPTSARVAVGSIIIIPPDGQVFITNQYSPNLSLPLPDIVITGTGISRLGAEQSVLGIDARGFGGNGSSVTLDARGRIRLSTDRAIDASAEIGQSGNIQLIATEGILLDDLASISAFSEDQGGDISLSTNGETLLGIGASILTSGGGNIQIQSNRLTMEPLSQISAPVNNIRDGGNIILQVPDSIRLDGGNVGTLTLALSSGSLPEFGDVGDIVIETGKLELIGFAFPDSNAPNGFVTGGDITADVLGNANAGDIKITAEQVRLLNGAQIRASTSGSGNTGNITIRAADFVEVTGGIPETDDVSKIAVSVNERATGNGENLLIETNRLIVRDEGQIQAGVLGAGQGGNVIINAPQSIEIIATREGNDATGIFTGPEGVRASGNGGTLNITTDQLTLRGDGAEISNEVDLLATGNAGNTIINANRLTIAEGGQIRAGTSYIRQRGSSEGRGGNLQITANEIDLTGTSGGTNEQPSGIFIGTLGQARAGSLHLTTGQLTIREGATITASTLGLNELGQGGNITINADNVELTGESASRRFASGIISEAGRVFIDDRFQDNAESRADGGNIRLTARQLTVQNGAAISTQTIGAGNAGDLTINATGTVQLLAGNLRTRTLGSGGAGDLTITAGQLIMRDGEATAATNNGGGRGGDIFVTVEGITEFTGGQAGLAAISFRSGDAGNLMLRTDQLTVRDGAGIATESIGRGRAGDITVVAARGVEVSGGWFQTGVEANAAFDRELPGAAPFDPSQTYFFPSRISAAVGSTEAGTPAANLSIQTGQLTISNGGEISTQTLSDSQGGRLSIHASQINLIGNSANLRLDAESRPSILSAQTLGTGDAGDIQLDVEQLQIQDGAAISAAAVAIPNSNSVVRGRPGNISIQNADSVTLTTGGEISTVIEPGVSVNNASAQRSNINIQTRSLSLNNRAQITASTSGQGNAGNITVRDANTVNLDRSNISTTVNTGAIGDGGSIDLQANSLQLNRANITASTQGQGRAGDINVRAAEQVALNRSTISTEVGPTGIGQGGNLNIQADALNLDRSNITSSTSGQGNTGSITLNVSDRINLRNRSRITNRVEAGATGNSRNITLNTPRLALSANSVLSAATNGRGAAGNIIVRNGEQNAEAVFLSDSSISTQVEANGAVPQASSQRNANQRNANQRNANQRSSNQRDRQTANRRGTITLDTDSLRLADGSQITANTANRGDAGEIRVRRADSVSVTEGSAISTAVNRGARGQGGNITLDANFLNLEAGQISANTAGRGNAGAITVRNADTLSIHGGSISTAVGRQSSGRGGSIDIDTSTLNLSNGATISSASQGRNRAGNINITAENAFRSENGNITTSAVQAAGGSIEITGGDIDLSEGSNVGTNVRNGSEDGGNITVTAAAVRLQEDSDIQTNVERGRGDGGDIAITANSVIAFDDSDIISSAPNQGGDITLDTPIFFGTGYQPDTSAEGEPDGNGRVDLDASGRVSSGAVQTPDTSFIQNSLSDLPTNAINTDQLLANSCIARTQQGGTFLITGPAGFPERPGALQSPAYPTGAVRGVPVEAEGAAEQSWQPGDPIVEPQGVYRLPDGRLVMSRDCHNLQSATPEPR